MPNTLSTPWLSTSAPGAPGGCMRGQEPSGDWKLADSILAGERRVLIADDCPDTRSTFAALLRLWGYEVRMACDGAAALETACAWRPDVVMADIAMPGVNGYELARRLRQLPEFEKLLLIAISGYADQAHRQMGLEAGYDAYLAKPAMASELQLLLRVKLIAACK